MTTTTRPTISHVEITTQADGTISIFPYWNGVDRPQGAGWGLRDTPAHRRLAQRLKKALEAGAVYYNVKAAVDINGNTYASASSRVLGRRLNADLTGLGF
jgi:hypothetical protein